MDRSKITPLIILVLAFIVYSYRLDFVPVHLNQDELAFSLNAYSIAKTLRDESGRVLPFYFWHLNSFWATPIIVYLTSIVLTFLPIAESTIRLSGVIVAIFSGIFLVRLTRVILGKKYSYLALVFFLTTPALFINSRVLLDNIFPIPFVLLWLLFFKRYLNSKKLMYLFWSGLFLGIGIHSYHAAKIYMPLYFLASLFFMNKTKRTISIFIFSLGFFVPIILFVPWLMRYPDTLLNQVSYVSSLDSSVNASRGILGVFNPSRLNIFISNYVTYLSPKILFIEGDRSLIHSTQMVGAFLFPIVFFLVFGLIKIIKEKNKFWKLILFGFLTYPIAPSIVNDPQRISRGLIVIPFAILLSIYGIKFMLESKEKALRTLFILLMAISVFQFGQFLYDYFGEYRVRSYRWFNDDIGGALESAIKSAQVRDVHRIYLDSNIRFVDTYYLFYQKKLDKDVLQPWEFFDYNKQDLSTLPEKSLVVLIAGEVKTRNDKIGQFEKIETIREPNGNESFYIFYNN